MKKPILFIVRLVAAFSVTYISLCYLVPAMKLKLAADPMMYFLESIKHMVAFKGMISFAVGLLAGAIPALIRKKREAE